MSAATMVRIAAVLEVDVQCSPGFESSASAGSKLEAVFADENPSRRVRSTRRRSKATTAKTFERGNKEFQSNHRKALVTSSFCE
jgi:hypothetical protein